MLEEIQLKELCERRERSSPSKTWDIEITIPGKPIPWKSHRGFGRRSFNPLWKEKEMVQWYTRSQYKEAPIQGPVEVSYRFFFQTPKSVSKKKKSLMLINEIKHTTRPDCTNLRKFYEDCIKNILFTDDSFACENDDKKFWSYQDETIIYVKKL